MEYHLRKNQQAYMNTPVSVRLSVVGMPWSEGEGAGAGSSGHASRPAAMLGYVVASVTAGVGLSPSSRQLLARVQGAAKEPPARCVTRATDAAPRAAAGLRKVGASPREMGASTQPASRSLCGCVSE